ncbi:DUF4232 domain-containing protein [Streptomyces bambusae]|uniref:DUF4232 domain-containing protein n=1 Tax=Streptomyces bambusae TaxID=1550616 RepID=UPI001CFCC2FF|nr:DUF4232 domain-containing protein [Streptomyces bambusae]MCB5165836.1 DUF4232 domain-containing protein [Streptomyces bambusae]
MRAVRTGPKTYVLGAAALAAVLSAIACQADGKDRRDGARPPAAPSASQPAAPGGAPSGAPKATGSAAPGRGTGKNGGTGDSGGSGTTAPVACSAASIALTGEFERQDSGQNIFLTAVNTGSRPCTLYFYPIAYFGLPDEVPPPPMESPAGAPATIRPGEKAYAAVRLFRGGARTDAVTSLKIGFHGKVANDEVGRPMAVRLPEGFLNIDDHTMVTFWNLSETAVKKYAFKAR